MQIIFYMKNNAPFKTRPYLMGILLFSLFLLPNAVQAQDQGPPQLVGSLPALKDIDSDYDTVQWVQTSFHTNEESLASYGDEVKTALANYSNFPIKLLAIGTYWYWYLVVGPLQSNPVLDTCEHLAAQQLAIRLSNPDGDTSRFRIHADKGTDLGNGKMVFWQNARDKDAYPTQLSCTLSKKE